MILALYKILHKFIQAHCLIDCSSSGSGGAERSSETDRNHSITAGANHGLCVNACYICVDSFTLILQQCLV